MNTIRYSCLIIIYESGAFILKTYLNFRLADGRLKIFSCTKSKKLITTKVIT